MNKHTVWQPPPTPFFFNNFLKGFTPFVGSFLVYEALTPKIVSHSFKNAIFTKLQAYIHTYVRPQPPPSQRHCKLCMHKYCPERPAQEKPMKHLSSLTDLALTSTPALATISAISRLPCFTAQSSAV